MIISSYIIIYIHQQQKNNKKRKKERKKFTTTKGECYCPVITTSSSSSQASKKFQTKLMFLFYSVILNIVLCNRVINKVVESWELGNGTVPVHNTEEEAAVGVASAAVSIIMQ